MYRYAGATPRHRVLQLLAPAMTRKDPSTFSETSLIIGTSRRIASASLAVNVVSPCAPVRTPATLRDPASIQTRLSPSLSSSASDCRTLARPSATTAITIATAAEIPRTASPLRSLLRDSARNASTVTRRAATRNSSMPVGSLARRERHGDVRSSAASPLRALAWTLALGSRTAASNLRRASALSPASASIHPSIADASPARALVA